MKVRNWHLRLAAGLLDLALALVLTLIPVLGVAYWLNKDALFAKGSLGKQAMKLTACTNTDQASIHKKYGTSIKRNFLLVVPGINVLEWVLILLGNRSLGDRWSGTQVLNYVDDKV